MPCSAALSSYSPTKYPCENKTNRPRIDKRTHNDSEYEAETPILTKPSREHVLKRRVWQLRPIWRADHEEVNERKEQKLRCKHCT